MTTLTYSTSANGLSAVDGTVNLSSPITVQGNGRFLVQLVKFVCSIRIPNIFNYSDGTGTFNNGLVRVTKDGGASWTDIQLPDGLYSSIAMINAAINTALNTWWADAALPGFKIAYNLATNLVYIIIDSTKLLAPGQLGIDFNGAHLSGSEFNHVLGYTATGNMTFITDGVFGADTNAQLNWFGDSILVWLHAFGPLTWFNGQSMDLLAKVPLSSSFGTNSTEYVFPVGLISPEIETTGAIPFLSKYTLEFSGSRDVTTGQAHIPSSHISNGKYQRLLLMDGELETTFRIKIIRE